ncbi:hypothetical protein PsorP6_018953 [Peronosclerospora sorghi]|nr:hypothetical protein PsorP6_018953 [Peronosclerospora sorghi]
MMPMALDQNRFQFQLYPNFVKIQNDHYEEIKFQYLKKNTAMALKVQHGELKMLNINLGIWILIF